MKMLLAGLAGFAAAAVLASVLSGCAGRAEDPQPASTSSHQVAAKSSVSLKSWPGDLNEVPYKLADGRTVPCIVTFKGGISCDWNNAVQG